MKWKALLAAGLVGLLSYGTAEARDALWFDKDAGIDRFQKVMLFPIADGDRWNYFSTDIQPYASYNYEMHKRLTRHAKGIKLYELFTPIDEKGQVVQVETPANIQALLQPFPSEEARAALINSSYAPDGYIVPYFRKRYSVDDCSPETTFYVPMEAYTEVKDSPRGNYTCDHSSWHEYYTVPERWLKRYITELEVTMFNEQGQPIMTCLNGKQSYIADFDDEFKYLKDDFADDLKVIKANKPGKAKNAGASIKIAVDSIDFSVPKGEDMHVVRGCWWTMKDEISRMKLARLAENGEAPDYYVTMDITRYEYSPDWIEPSYSTSLGVDWSKEEKWTDRYGKEHKKKTTRYSTRVSPIYGRYSFVEGAKVNATVRLYNARTGERIFGYNYKYTNDKFADAIMNIARDFYKDVDKYLGR